MLLHYITFSKIILHVITLSRFAGSVVRAANDTSPLLLEGIAEFTGSPFIIVSNHINTKILLHFNLIMPAHESYQTETIQIKMLASHRNSKTNVHLPYSILLLGKIPNQEK